MLPCLGGVVIAGFSSLVGSTRAQSHQHWHWLTRSYSTGTSAQCRTGFILHTSPALAHEPPSHPHHHILIPHPHHHILIPHPHILTPTSTPSPLPHTLTPTSTHPHHFLTPMSSRPHTLTPTSLAYSTRVPALRHYDPPQPAGGGDVGVSESQLCVDLSIRYRLT